MAESVGLIVKPQHGPPVNELPVVADVASSWIGDGVAVAVPSCLVYSTGMLLTVIGRTRARRRSGDIQEAARLIREGLEDRPGAVFRLTVNGGRASLMGGHHQNYGWEYQLWKSFGEAGPQQGLTLVLDWPEAGLSHGAHEVAGETLLQAAGRVITLWPLPTDSESA